MSFYIIKGGNRLEGSLRIHGAKNAVLPILAAATLCDSCHLTNCPGLSDVSVAIEILSHLGSDVFCVDDEIVITQHGNGDYRIPDELMSAMRSSIVFLGAMLARYGCAEMTLPGGCELGERPIDLHLMALKKMGVKVLEEGKLLHCMAPEGIHGATIELPFPSVGATENIIIAAVTAHGETVLKGAAREPEITDLIDFLCAAGAKIVRSLDGTIYIEGVTKLHSCTHAIIPDRIAAGTYLAAAAVTGGDIELTGVKPAHLLSTLAYLSIAGCNVRTEINRIILHAPRNLKEFGNIKTEPYPGFPTDMQAIMMAVACTCKGTTIFTENIFDSRFKHVPELRKLGADIMTQGRVAVVSGVEKLAPASVHCTDLRGGAALIVAALAAEGNSVITDLHHVDRGYEKFEDNLTTLGAVIARGGR